MSSRIITAKLAMEELGLDNKGEFLDYAASLAGSRPLLNLYFDSPNEREIVALNRCQVNDIRNNGTYEHLLPRKVISIPRRSDEETGAAETEDDFKVETQTLSITFNDLFVDFVELKRFKEEYPEFVKTQPQKRDDDMTEREKRKLLRVIGLLTEALAGTDEGSFKHESSGDINKSQLIKLSLHPTLDKLSISTSKFSSSLLQQALKGGLEYLEESGEYKE